MSHTTKILKPAGLDQTKWGQRIIQAEERNHFTENDIHLAADWPTCACGETYVRNPFECLDPQGDYERAPTDHVLQRLGADFSIEVNHHNYSLAAETMVEIEQRAIEIARN